MPHNEFSDRNVCHHLLQHDPGQQLRAGAVSGYLPVPRRFQKAGFLRGHGRCCYRRHGHCHGCDFPLQIFLLDAYNLGYLQTIIFILVIAVLVQLIEITLKKYVPALYQSLGVYLPLITTNCCVLGVTILAVQDYSAVVAEFGFGLAYAEALICAAGAGVGFLVAMLLFCGVRSRVEAANPPESFKGLPITLVSAAITSMSFMGFGGLVENIINAIF